MGRKCSYFIWIALLIDHKTPVSGAQRVVDCCIAWPTPSRAQSIRYVVDTQAIFTPCSAQPTSLLRGRPRRPQQQTNDVIMRDNYTAGTYARSPSRSSQWPRVTVMPRRQEPWPAVLPHPLAYQLTLFTYLLLFLSLRLLASLRYMDLSSQ